MSAAFLQWNDRITAANDVGARRALLAEVASWRARHLSDVPAMREATYAMTRLHDLLGDHEASVREARSLWSLCQSAPPPSDEQIASAHSLLRGFGEAVPKLVAARPERKRGDRPERPERERRDRAERPERSEQERRERPERTGSARDRAALAEAGSAERGVSRDQALELAGRGDWSGALGTMVGRKGAPAELMRAWLQLSRALAASGEARERDLRDLEAALRRRVAGGREERAERAEREERATGDDALSQLIGRPAPKRRERKIEAIEAWVRENPGRVDEIASVALQDHVDGSGLQAPAPWLAGVVGQALAAGGERTREAVARLKERGAFAVTAYEEAPAKRAIALLGTAAASGWAFGGLRRGVAARGEPADRKLWTLRLVEGGTERMVVFGPQAESAYPEGMASRLAQRLTRLCARVVVVAPGAGNAGLREAVSALGMRATAEDPGDAGLLDALRAARPVEPVGDDERDEREAQEARAGAPAREPRAPKAEAGPRAATGGVAAREGQIREPAALREPPPDDELAAVLASDDVTVASLSPVVAKFRRKFRALVAAERALGVTPPDDKAAAVLLAVDQLAEADESLPEGTTLAIRAVASGGHRCRTLLTEGSTAARFGGVGIDVVAELARVATADGWELHRVLRGPTRREQRDHVVLETLGEHLGGLWRLLVRKGDVKGEVWYVAELPAEGRAALPQLLLEPHHRAVVLPIDRELLGWYGTLRGPEAIGWTGGEGDALLAELAGWSATAA